MDTTLSAVPKLFVEIGRVLYIGPWEEAAEHTPMVPIFGAGLDGDISLVIDGEPFNGRTVSVPSGTPRSVNAFGRRLAVMPFDPAHGTIGSVDEPAAIDALCALAAAEEVDVVAWTALSAALGLQSLQSIDDRVRDAAHFIDSHSNENVPGAEVAEAVNYSLSRLQDLFRAQLGVSMRSYRSWSRLRRIGELMHTAPTLTDAAVEAGFYDAAHFSRTFMATFGVMPSEVFTSGLRVHVLKDRLA